MGFRLSESYFDLSDAYQYYQQYDSFLEPQESRSETVTSEKCDTSLACISSSSGGSNRSLTKKTSASLKKEIAEMEKLKKTVSCSRLRRAYYEGIRRRKKALSFQGALEPGILTISPKSIASRKRSDIRKEIAHLKNLENREGNAQVRHKYQEAIRRRTEALKIQKIYADTL